MVKQLLLPLAGVALFIIIVGMFSQKSSSLDWGKYLSTNTPKETQSMTVGSKTITVEIANTTSLRERGLSGRSSLAENTGMLFVFETKPVTPTFWMKDMAIPLDIIWIKDGKVVKLDKKVPFPAPGTADSSLKTYPAGVPIDYVLEVNAGFSDKNNLKVGDSVALPTL